MTHDGSIEDQTARGRLGHDVPPSLLKLIKVGEGDDVALAVNKGSLVVRPAARSRKRYTIAELLEGAETLADLNAQTASGLHGNPVGRELGE